MDPDEIARLVNEMKLSCTDPNEIVNLEEVEIRIGEERLSRCLVAKVFSSKSINREAFRQQMPRTLQTERHMIIEATGENTLVFEFYSQRDQNRVLNGGLWNFSRNLLVFNELTGLSNPRSMSFKETNIWVQLHNIPLAFMHEDLLTKLGSRIGQVIEVDRGENGTCLGRFARIRVRLDITKPLKKCLRISVMREEEDTIILLVYEKLPDFYYACGRLGHSLRECDEESANKVNLGFGAWMRASSHIRSARGSRTGGVKQDGPRNDENFPEASNQPDSQALIQLESDTNGTRIMTNGYQHKDNRMITQQAMGCTALNGETERVDLANIPARMFKQPSEQPQVVGKVEKPGLTDLASGGQQTKNPTTEPKKWKRRARENSSKISHASDSLSGTGLKRNLLVNYGTESEEYNNPTKKRAKNVEEAPTLNDNTAAVALQPRRSP